MTLETARATRLSREAMEYRIKRDVLLAQYPELADDEQALLDTLEGLTNVHEQLAAMLRSAVTDEALAHGLHEYQAKLADRKSSLIARAQRKRRIALHYMEDLNLKNLVVPDMTVTRKNVPPSVIITEPEKIPEHLMRVKREPDKTLIKEAIANGESVPGAEMSNGSETLQIKV